MINLPRRFPELLPVLAENPLFDPHELVPVLQKLSADLIRDPPKADPDTASAFLRALWVVNMRSGGWSGIVNGAEKDQSGVLVMILPARPAPLSIQNPMDLTALHHRKRDDRETPPRAESRNAIARHFYQLDGNERAAGELGEGETYMVTLEGAWPGDRAHGQKLFIHDAAGGELRPLSCARSTAISVSQRHGDG